jgi:hypothetical protein
MRGLLIAIAGLLASGWGAAGNGRLAADAQLFPDAPAIVTIHALRGQGQERTLLVRRAGNADDEAVAIGAPPVRAPYAGLVQADWSGDRLAEGAEVRLSRFDGRALTIERRVGQPATNWEPLAADVAGWELCYARLYFELGSEPMPRRADTHFAVATVSASLALHRAPHAIWILGPGDRLLKAYQTPSAITYAAKTYGQPGLLASVEPIHDLLPKLAGHDVLVKTVPFRYQNRQQRPVGGWGSFVVAVYRDQSDTQSQLAAIVDYSSRLSVR